MTLSSTFRLMPVENFPVTIEILLSITTNYFHHGLTWNFPNIEYIPLVCSLWYNLDWTNVKMMTFVCHLT